MKEETVSKALDMLRELATEVGQTAEVFWPAFVVYERARWFGLIGVALIFTITSFCCLNAFRKRNDKRAGTDKKQEDAECLYLVIGCVTGAIASVMTIISVATVRILIAPEAAALYRLLG